MKVKLLKLWTDFAYQVADLSTCDRTKVGSLLLSTDGERLLAYGYNGGLKLPGLPNAPTNDTPGTDFWVHAEANALVKTRPVEPFLCLLTHTPCVRCAQLLVNSGVKKVLALDRYRDPAGWDLLRSLPLRSDDFRLVSEMDQDQVARWFS